MADEQKEQKARAVAAAVERANKEAGYDVPLAWAALNAEVIDKQKEMAVMPMFETRVDVTAVTDIAVRANGGRMDENVLSFLMNFAMAYGWHWARQGESLVRSEAIKKELLAFIDGNERMLVEEKVKRKEAIGKGIEAIAGAMERASARLKIKVAMKRS